MLKRDLSWLQPIALASIVVGGFALRVAHLGRASLWLDEGATAAIASLDWPSFGKVMFSREMNMVAYYCLLRFIPGLQASEAALRSLSVLFGTGTIVATWLLAKELFAERRGWLWALAAAALASANGFLIAYSQEARGYAMALCLLILSTTAAIRVVRTGRLSVTWCVLGLLTLYSHFYTVLWIAPQAWAIWKTQKHRGRKFFAPLLGTALIGLIPLCGFVLRTRGGQLDWVPRLTAGYFWSIFVQLAGYSRTALIVLMVGSMLGSVGLWKRGDIAARLIVLENVVPICILLAFSPLHSLFVARFLMFEIPFLTLTAMEAFATSSPGLGALAFAPIMTAMLLAGNQSPAKADWRSMTASLCGDHRQALAFWPAAQSFPYRYYAQSNKACPNPIFPPGERIVVSDFQPSKHEFDARLCDSKAQSVLLVVDSESQPGREPGRIRTPCYLPEFVTYQSGLQLIGLNLRAALLQKTALERTR